MQNPSILSLLHHATTAGKTKTSSKTTSKTGGGLFRMFKLLPMLSTGCKMAALLGGGRHLRRHLLADHASVGTLFGHRKGRLTLAIQEDPHKAPVFVAELPMHTVSLHKEMAHDVLRIALETDTKTRGKKLLEEYVWAVFVNGRRVGFSVRRNVRSMSEDEAHVMQMLRGVSMGAGVLPGKSPEKEDAGAGEGELTYIRVRFDRVVGSKDCESFYMINPDGASGHQELSIFFSRVR